MQYFIHMLKHRNTIMKKFLSLSKVFLNQPSLQKNFKTFSENRKLLLPELIQICQFMKTLSTKQMGIYEGFESEQLKAIFQESDILWKDIYENEKRLMSVLEQVEEAEEMQALEQKLA